MNVDNAPAQLLNSDYVGRDPGDGGALVIDRQFLVFGLDTAGAETRTVADPTKAGLRFTLGCRVYVGNCVVTFESAYDESAHTDITFTAAGQYAGFVSVEVDEDVYAWRIVENNGATGPVTTNVGTGTLNRAYLVQDDLQPYPILPESWYIWDSATHDPLGATALSADDLIYTLAAFGTGNPVITGTDPGGGTPTQLAQTRYVLPPEYVAGQTLQIAIVGFTGTTLADSFSKVDLNVYRLAAPTVDICATAEQSINSLTPVTVTFDLTPTDCVPGDVLNIKLTYAGSDAGNLGTMVPTISKVTLLADIKG